MNRLTKIACGVGGVVLGGLALSWWSRPRPAKLPLLVMGDSIAVGVGRALERLFPDQVVTLAREGECVRCTRDRVGDRLAQGPRGGDIVLSTGTNSLDGSVSTEDLVRQISAIIQTLRESSSTSRRVFYLAPPPAMNSSVLSEVQKENLRDLTVAVELGFRDVVSLWSIVGDEDGQGSFRSEYGTPGGLHPNQVGYEAIAQAIMKGWVV